MSLENGGLLPTTGLNYQWIKSQYLCINNIILHLMLLCGFKYSRPYIVGVGGDS